MKRENPETGKPFKRWEIDPKKPNLVFRSYAINKINSNGYFEEVWMTEKKLLDDTYFYRNPEEQLASPSIEGGGGLCQKTRKNKAKN